MRELEAKLATISYRPDFAWQHVDIRDQARCQECPGKECLVICPVKVFQWTHNNNDPVSVHYRQCVECGACRLACPKDNIAFCYPRAGGGVVFREG